MNPTILPRDHVAHHLAISTKHLMAYERRGLVRVSRSGEVEGYAPAEVRRLWTVVSLHRDAGINLAGIEAILQMQARLEQVCRQLHHLAEQLDEAIGDEQVDESTDQD
ncbi:chaperone modulator CbpM [Tautonia rosea]|uniref:chaperone modulator CbpM n=1 Tax=Tautonia rosea TaxID=2728037 RepID=UPI0014758269|nr:chaperone modulator CbpM [Tautonia rosea]